MGSCPARQSKRNFDTRLFDSYVSSENHFSDVWVFHDFCMLKKNNICHESAPEVSGRCSGPSPTNSGPFRTHSGPKSPKQNIRQHLIISPIQNLISEVGGSEFAFRQAPPNREIVSCRTCVRAVWLHSHIPGQIQGVGLFPFPFCVAGLSLFPFVIGFPFSLVP